MGRAFARQKACAQKETRWARPGGVTWATFVLSLPALEAFCFGHVFALRARPGGVAWAAFALLRPPLWRDWAAFPFCLSTPALEAHLGSCIIPAPALEAPLGHCTRVGTPQGGETLAHDLNLKRKTGTQAPTAQAGALQDPYHVTLALPDLKFHGPR